MVAYLKFMMLFAVIMIPIYLIAKAVGAARKRRMLGALEENSLPDLQAKARALWSSSEHRPSILVYRLTSSQYGPKIEALTESLLEATFSEKTGREESQRFLGTHYAWLIDLFRHFLEANWSWTETADRPGRGGFQIYYTETSPAGSDSVVRRYPRARQEIAAGQISETLTWLESLARRQNELYGIWAPGDDAFKSVPKWDVAIFASQVQTQSTGMLHEVQKNLIEIKCPPSVLRLEIERLRPQPAAPSA